MHEIFEDRQDAGKRLAAELNKNKRDDVVILALPRGGIEIAQQVSKVLNAPFDCLFVRKLGSEFNPEVGIGAIVEGNPPQTFLNEDLVKVLKITPDFIEQEKKRQLEVMREQEKKFRPNLKRLSLTGKSVIVVDDGVATGATVKAALKGLKSEKPKKLILAVPVAPPSTVAELKKDVDEVVCVLTPTDFQAVGQFYRRFPRLDDEKVIKLLGGS